METIAPFSIARLPRIVFGEGALSSVSSEARAFGTCTLLVTGARSFRSSPFWPRLRASLEAAGIRCVDVAVDEEPSPGLVDGAVAQYRSAGVDMVIGVGGGSALDAAKAIAGLLRSGISVLDHLEGVGRQVPYHGPAVPFIAVPTTAGTGSEATKNAVLSVRGDRGFKKSFRDEALVARVAIVDPELLASCPRDVLIANGMDAFTQLLESYVSANANPMTDALAWSGMEAFRDGFAAAVEGPSEQARAGRTRLAYAALASGIALAQAGLGSVHGLASPLGAFFPVPHGVVCGTLVAEATAVNVRALRERQPDAPALAKYARVGGLLAGREGGELAERVELLVETLRRWVERWAIPRLGRYGLGTADLGRVVANSRGGSMKTNPIVLTDDEVGAIVAPRI